MKPQANHITLDDLIPTCPHGIRYFCDFCDVADDEPQTRREWAQWDKVPDPPDQHCPATLQSEYNRGYWDGYGHSWSQP